MSFKFSEAAEALAKEVSRAFLLRNVDEGMAKLEGILNNPDGLSADEIERFQKWHLQWSRAIDRTYWPPRVAHDDVLPLKYRMVYCTQRADKVELLIWAYIQRCAFGTIAFHDALELMIGFAIRIERPNLARHAAEILLHHYAILNLVRYNPLMPVGMNE